jgi:Na+-translocating ferredoxin:NAD+ oxidoreductase subunit D
MSGDVRSKAGSDAGSKARSEAGGDTTDIEPIRITTSPQIHAPASTGKIMWTVSLALTPATIWGVYVFGIHALITVLVSIAAAVVTELVIARISHKFTLHDGSAVLTGLLIGMNMPPEIPWYIPVVASVFAIAVVKWTFGGLGANWMNPALAGRAVVFFSWTAQMTTWRIPRAISSVDGVTGATVLGTLKSGLLNYTGDANGPMQFLREMQYQRSPVDIRWTDSLNRLFDGVGFELPGGYIDLFVGNISGCIGEVSAVLLLAGAVLLFAKKIISWQIPVAYFGTFAVLILCFGGSRYGAGFGAGNVLFHALSGGLMLGVFFMATDMVTSPLTGRGMLIYGAGAGFLTFLIRIFGSFPEGVSLAILLMNVFVPMIDRFMKSTRFGVGATDE